MGKTQVGENPKVIRGEELGLKGKHRDDEVKNFQAEVGNPMLK